MRFWFFDTQIEDQGLYQFLSDCELALGVSIERHADGRHPWQVFRDERFIGNARAPLCNRVLKRELLERLLKTHFPANNVVLYFGLEWIEGSRIAKVGTRWRERKYRVDFPLAAPPFMSTEDFMMQVRQAGVEVPRLYQMGFKHNNCGGACVQAGIGQWSRLWRLFPDRYVWHERQEEETRQYLGKNVAILRERTGGITRPLTLRELRSRLECGLQGIAE